MSIRELKTITRNIHEMVRNNDQALPGYLHRLNTICSQFEIAQIKQAIINK